VFFFLEHPITTWFPHTPVVLRALPFIFGILGVVAVWAFAKRIIGERGALFAALLATLSPWHLEASGFGRYYSLLFLLATLVYSLLPQAYDSDRPRTYLLTLLALLLGSWTHPSFVFPVAAAALAVTLVRPDGKISWRWPSANAWKFLWIPFVVLSGVIFAIMRVLSPSVSVANGEDRGLLATLRLIPAMVDWMTPVVFIAAAAGALLLIFAPNIPGPGPSSTSRDSGNAIVVIGRRRFGMMALFGVTGMIFALFVLSFVTAIYADYGISALPLVFVAAAAFVEWIAETVAPARRGIAVAAIMTLIVVGVLPSAVSHLSDGTRFDYRPAYSRIMKDSPSTAVLTWPIALQVQYAPALHAYEIPSRAHKLDSLLTKERDLWAVVSVKRYGIVGDDAGELSGWLRQRCRPVDEYQRPRLDYRMYRVDLWRCTQHDPTL
jgi:hypothetical protein